MNSKQKNPFRNLKLTREEREIEEAIEADKYQEAGNPEELKKAYQIYAKDTLSKLKNINIRLSVRDLEKLKAKAAESGLPYQTLAATLLHQYSNDKLRVSL